MKGVSTSRVAQSLDDVLPVPKIDARWWAMVSVLERKRWNLLSCPSVTTNNNAKQVSIPFPSTRTRSEVSFMPRDPSEAPKTPNKKRKRSYSREPSLGPPPVVTFTSPGRTFRRVLKGMFIVNSLRCSSKGLQLHFSLLYSLRPHAEESLNEFKRSIRAKLHLSEGARLYLAQTKEGRRIDLDDG